MKLSTLADSINNFGSRMALLTILTGSGCTLDVVGFFPPSETADDEAGNYDTDNGSTASDEGTTDTTTSTTGDESSESTTDTTTSTTGDESSESSESTTDTTTTTDTGSNTGELICTIMEGRDACTTCLESLCGEEKNNCITTDADCCDYANCVLDPNNDLTNCETQYPENLLVTNLADCIASNCAGACE